MEKVDAYVQSGIDAVVTYAPKLLLAVVVLNNWFVGGKVNWQGSKQINEEARNR